MLCCVCVCVFASFLWISHVIQNILKVLSTCCPSDCVPIKSTISHTNHQNGISIKTIDTITTATIYVLSLFISFFVWIILIILLLFFVHMFWLLLFSSRRIKLAKQVKSNEQKLKKKIVLFTVMIYKLQTHRRVDIELALVFCLFVCWSMVLPARIFFAFWDWEHAMCVPSHRAHHIQIKSGACVLIDMGVCWVSASSAVRNTPYKSHSPAGIAFNIQFLSHHKSLHTIDCRFDPHGRPPSRPTPPFESD